jgi:high affinity Mn2+ porin
MRFRVTAAGFVVAASLLRGVAAHASDSEDPPEKTPPPKHETFAFHGEFTYVEQGTSGFKAPYSGLNSLSPNRGAETIDANIAIGGRLWSGAEGWISPEVDQGFGLDDTLGVAGFPSGEAYKIGKNKPYLRLQRLFIRDTFDLDGAARETVDPGAFWLGGDRSVNRLVFTVGKISVTDIFDVNQYAHDPRADFLNWSAIDAGTFDYAADSWGYTVGAAVEWYRGDWTLRAGSFALSDIPNSPDLEPAFHEFQMILEPEHRHEIAGHPGKVMITVFDTRGRMGLLDQAVQLAQSTDTPVNIAAVRQYRSRRGADINFQQELASDLGMFARVGKAAGNVEVYEFTDIDRTVSTGLSLKGSAWRRQGDTVGLALIDNGISAAREQYLNAGGLGVLVGDGKLPHPGPEEIVETYYCASLLSFAQVTLDYQWINNPAYNRDRGPVSVFAVRVHAQF